LRTVQSSLQRAFQALKVKKRTAKAGFWWPVPVRANIYKQKGGVERHTTLFMVFITTTALMENMTFSN